MTPVMPCIISAGTLSRRAIRPSGVLSGNEKTPHGMGGLRDGKCPVALVDNNCGGGHYRPDVAHLGSLACLSAISLPVSRCDHLDVHVIGDQGAQTLSFRAGRKPHLVASHLGVGGHRYVACHEVPSVSARRTGSAPVGAVRPRPIGVGPRPGSALDVAAPERARAELQRPRRTVRCCPNCGAVACLRVVDGSAAGVAGP
jgi:hypothetical protein